MDRRILGPWCAVTGLFLAAVMGAWAWFFVAPRPKDPGLKLSISRELAGWRFRSEPLSPAVQATLATPELFNGTFIAETGNEVTVFAANWVAGSARVMSVVEHTPDICWVGAGFVPVDLGQPTRVELSISGRPLPFECRAFRGPRGGPPELVLWCTLVDGQVLPEGDRWEAEMNADLGSDDRRAQAGRRKALGHFLQNVSTRRAADGEKQFIRFSVAVTTDWRDGLERLRSFGGRWLAAL
ncbi:MAG: exosortase-associated EpsI family protein [Verrucomicrobiales bacterium]|nr:exosortase-associated EpsI family protein [Verrucomicrobiales bacterium]